MLTRRSLLAGLGAVARAQVQPPNILLLISDDQRPDTIGALGNRIIQTPHLDRLAGDGAAFTRATCANPLCVPSRAELISGATGFRNGVPDGGRLKEGLALWPEVFRRHGYDTAYCGKWHHDGRPRDKGFTAAPGLYVGGGGRFAKPATDWNGREVTGYRGWLFETEDGRQQPELGVGLTPDISERIAGAACSYLGQARTKPFFLQVSFTAPHDPLLFPPGFERTYDPGKIPLPPNFLPEHPFDHGNLRGRDELLMPFPRNPKDVREELACYYAVLTHMDREIGRILQALRAAGQAENTVVIFTSDNGLAIGSHGLRGKQNLYEHSIGVPLIVRGPGVARGTRSDALCYLRDLFPTACDFAGIRPPDTVQGQSLRPFLTGRPHPSRQEIYGSFRDAQRMIRTDRWKLIWYPKIGREQLFDLRNDPHEVRDRIADRRLAPLASDLRTRLRAWLRAEGDPVVA
ncbi:MAG: sulfatase-like hydrolase/transferase [Bryobacterales bacterium]|nr:sulfatase-like hydrolase/transferase [Bryobacterales bacterium]